MATAQKQAGSDGDGSYGFQITGIRSGQRGSRFRYGYICRLIDDGELQTLPPALRARTRAAHKTAYWKSISLMRRDADLVLRLRRERMAAQGQWDFQTLVNDYARVQLLLARLTLAGVSHTVRLGAGIEAAREVCNELEMLLTSPALLPAVSA